MRNTYARFARKDLWLLRGVALIISIMLWITVLGGKRVEVDKVVELEYKIPPEMVLANQPQKKLTFRISGPQAFVKEYELRDNFVSIDLRDRERGEYEVDTYSDMLDLPLGLEVVSISQEKVVVQLDKAIRMHKPIRPIFSGSLPKGVDIKSVVVKPSMVEFRGSKDRLQSIHSVSTESIQLAPNSLLQEFEVGLNSKDMMGIKSVKGLESIKVLVELKGSLSRKWLRKVPVGLKQGSGVAARYVNQQKSGYRLSPTTVDILVEGPDSVMKSLKPKSIAIWAEVEEIQKNQTYSAPLVWKLAPELRVVKSNSNTVEIRVP